MSNILLYLMALFMVFFSCAVIFFCLRFSFWIYTEYWSQDQPSRRHMQRCAEREIRGDRQGNTCAQTDASGRDNLYDDIFFIEPNSHEAARIRAQLEKDDKDLPSYDEVMRIANLSAPTTAPAANAVLPVMPSALSMGASSSSVNTSDTTVSVPSYKEDGTNVLHLMPPPYTPKPIGATVAVLPITAPLHSQQQQHHTQSL